MNKFARFIGTELGGESSLQHFFFGKDRRTLFSQGFAFNKKGPQAAQLQWGDSHVIVPKPRTLHVLSNYEFRQCASAYRMHRATEMADAASKTTAATNYTRWIESLPDRLDDETRVDKLTRSLVDNYGNHLLRLPASPVDDLAAWVGKQLDGMEIE